RSEVMRQPRSARTRANPRRPRSLGSSSCITTKLQVLGVRRLSSRPEPVVVDPQVDRGQVKQRSLCPGLGPSPGQVRQGRLDLGVQAAGGKSLGKLVTYVALPALLGPILGPLIGGAI